MNQKLLHDWVLPTVVVSVCYFFSFVITFGYLWPLQQQLVPGATVFAILVFLPHGVRVITAWLYGWRSVVFLAPASFATQIYLWGLLSIDVGFVSATVIGISCATFSFWALAKAGMDFRLVQGKVAHWQDVVIAGTVASVLNSAVSLWFYEQLDAATITTRFAGDMIGMLTLMAALAVLLWIFALRR